MIHNNFAILVDSVVGDALNFDEISNLVLPDVSLIANARCLPFGIVSLGQRVYDILNAHPLVDLFRVGLRGVRFRVYHRVLKVLQMDRNVLVPCVGHLHAESCCLLCEVGLGFRVCCTCR